MSFEVFWPLLVAILVPLGIWRVQWAANKAEKGNEERDKRINELEKDVHRLELQIAGDLPNREDIKDLQREVESVRAMCMEMRDWMMMSRGNK